MGLLAQVGQQLAFLARWHRPARAAGPRHRSACDSGCRRRVSEKRRTSVSVVASRNSDCTATPCSRSCRELLRHQRQRGGAAHVHGDGHLAGAVLLLQRDEGQQQLGRQVVHAVVAGVFQRVQGHRLARARHAGDQHHVEHRWQVSVTASLIGPASPWRGPAWCPRAFRRPACARPRRRAARRARASTVLAVWPLSAAFGHHQVLVGAGRHLRQVGDGQHLAVACRAASSAGPRFRPPRRRRRNRPRQRSGSAPGPAGWW